MSAASSVSFMGVSFGSATASAAASQADTKSAAASPAPLFSPQKIALLPNNLVALSNSIADFIAKPNDHALDMIEAEARTLLNVTAEKNEISRRFSLIRSQINWESPVLSTDIYRHFRCLLASMRRFTGGQTVNPPAMIEQMKQAIIARNDNQLRTLIDNGQILFPGEDKTWHSPFYGEANFSLISLAGRLDNVTAMCMLLDEGCAIDCGDFFALSDYNCNLHPIRLQVESYRRHRERLEISKVLVIAERLLPFLTIAEDDYAPFPSSLYSSSSCLLRVWREHPPMPLDSNSDIPKRFIGALLTAGHRLVIVDFDLFLTYAKDLAFFGYPRPAYVTNTNSNADLSREITVIDQYMATQKAGKSYMKNHVVSELFQSSPSFTRDTIAIVWSYLNKPLAQFEVSERFSLYNVCGQIADTSLTLVQSDLKSGKESTASKTPSAASATASAASASTSASASEGGLKSSDVVSSVIQVKNKLSLSMEQYQHITAFLLFCEQNSRSIFKRGFDLLLMKTETPSPMSVNRFHKLYKDALKALNAQFQALGLPIAGDSSSAFLLAEWGASVVDAQEGRRKIEDDHNLYHQHLSASAAQAMATLKMKNITRALDLPK